MERPPSSAASTLLIIENQLSFGKECYGKLDGIRRKLTTGFIVPLKKV